MAHRTNTPDPRPASDDPQALAEAIEQTRRRLGEAVEALVTKTDVKARAKQQRAKLSARMRAGAAQARDRTAAVALQRHVQVAVVTGTIAAASAAFVAVMWWRRR